jgi:hypothetical protein
MTTKTIQGGLRQQPDAERMQYTDRQRRPERAGDRTESTNDDHDEGLNKDRQIHLKVDCLARNLQRAAEAGQARAEREHRREQQPFVDAERSGHLPVLRRRAHDRAPAGALEEPPEQREHQRSDRGQQQVVFGNQRAANADRAFQAGRPRRKPFLRPPERQHGVLHDQRHAEGRQQLEDLRRRVDPSQHHYLDHDANGGDHERRENEPAEKPEGCRRQRGRHRRRDVGTKHVKRAVREVDDTRDAEDQCQPGADEEQRRAVRESREELTEDEVQEVGAVQARE